MRRTGILIITAAIAALMAACGGTVENKPANTANTAKSAPAAPTAETLMALDKDATEKYYKGDAAAFETILSDKAVMSQDGKHMGKAAIIEGIKTVKCEGVAVNLSEPQLSKINDDIYAVTFKDASTGKCTENGKTMDLKPMRASTIWMRNGEKWQAAWHGWVPIMEAPAGEKKDDKAADMKKDEAKKEDKPAEVKKEEPKKDAAVDMKKDEAKKDDAKKDDKAATDAKPAAMQPSANTDALTKTHAAGWEAFRNKDAKWFEDHMASTFAFVNPAGSYVGSKAQAIKDWTGQGSMKCEGITKTSFTDTFAFALSPTVEILMGKGNADGTCDGMKNGDLWQTSAYVKEGDAWKLAFMFEEPGKPAGK